MPTNLRKNLKAIVYLYDAVFSLNPLNYVSNLFLSSAVYNRFMMPQINVLSKCDLLPKEEVDRIVNWSSSKTHLADAIDEKLEGTKRLFSRNMMQAIYRLGLQSPLIPISSKTNDGMINFNTAIERVLAAGDKYTF